MSPPPASARERILVTAAAMFETDGVIGTGINAIIARSEVAKDTLYKHFSTKDDLVVEVVRRRDRHWCDQLRDSVENAATDPHGRLLAVFDFVDAELRDPTYRGSVFLAASSDYPDVNHPVRQACIEHKDRVRDYLMGLARDAALADPKTVAFQLLLLIDGAICARSMQGDRDAGGRAKQAAAILIEAGRR